MNVLKEGKTYTTRDQTGSGEVLAVVAERAIVRHSSRFIGLYKLDGTFLGHWWEDGKPTSTAKPKDFFDANQHDNVSGFYHLEIPTQVYLQRVLFDRIDKERPFRLGIKGKIELFNRNSFTDTQCIGVYITVNDTENFFSMNEFRASKYFNMQSGGNND